MDSKQQMMKNSMMKYPGLRPNVKLKTLPQPFVRQCCVSPLGNLESKSSGEYKLEKDIKPPASVMTVVSIRNQLMMGYRATTLKTDVPRIIHKLTKDEGRLLMSDSPQEMFLQYENYKQATGRVLVGGLGLGMYANMIANKPGVTEVVVIEISKDVINLTEPSHPKITVINADIWKYLKTTKDTKWDYIYIDIHYMTGAYEYMHTVLPMREILDKRFKGVKAGFWAEEEMKSQYQTDEERMQELMKKVKSQ